MVRVLSFLTLLLSLLGTLSALSRIFALDSCTCLLLHQKRLFHRTPTNVGVALRLLARFQGSVATLQALWDRPNTLE